MKPRRILVGVDEGDLARHAVREGCELARRFEAGLELVHCVPLESEAWAAAAAIDWYAVRTDILVDRRNRLLERLKEGCPDPLPDGRSLDDALVVLDTRPSRALAKYATDRKADLIVLGGHKKAGIFDFGGTARALLHHSPCAVWVQPNAPREVKTVLAPIDPEEASPATLDWLRAVAAAYGAKLVLMHVFSPPEFAYEPFHAASDTLPVAIMREAAEKRFLDFCEEDHFDGVEVEKRFVEGNPVKAILDAQDSVDLIALGTHGRGAVERAVLGSVAYGVLKGATHPVLAIPFRAEARLLDEPHDVARSRA